MEVMGVKLEGKLIVLVLDSQVLIIHSQSFVSRYVGLIISSLMMTSSRWVPFGYLVEVEPGSDLFLACLFVLGYLPQQDAKDLLRPDHAHLLTYETATCRGQSSE